MFRTHLWTSWIRRVQYLDMFVIVFIDDILIYSRSEDEHTDDLRIVLQVSKDQQLFEKLENVSFG